MWVNLPDHGLKVWYDNIGYSTTFMKGKKNKNKTACYDNIMAMEEICLLVYAEF